MNRLERIDLSTHEAYGSSPRVVVFGYTHEGPKMYTGSISNIQKHTEHLPTFHAMILYYGHGSIYGRRWGLFGKHSNAVYHTNLPQFTLSLVRHQHIRSHSIRQMMSKSALCLSDQCDKNHARYFLIKRNADRSEEIVHSWRNLPKRRLKQLEEIG